MLFKHRDAVTWDDLPWIKNASFAWFKAEGTRRGFGQSVIGLEDLLWKDTSFRGSAGGNGQHSERQALERLRKRIENYEVVLVDRSGSGSPLFQWRKEEGHPQGGQWDITTQDPFEKSKLDRLLYVARTSAGGLAVAGKASARVIDEASPEPRAPRDNVPRRDIAVVLNDEFRARLGQHGPLVNGTRYKLTTDQGEVREGTVRGGKIEESQVVMNQTLRIELVTPV